MGTRTVAAVGAFILTVAMLTACRSDVPQEEYDDLASRLAATESQLADARSEIDALRTQVEDAQERIDTLETEAEGPRTACTTRAP